MPKILVRIDCTTPKRMPTSLAMLRRSHLLSHITRACKTLTFSSAVACFGADSPSIIPTISLSLLDSAAHFLHCDIRRRLFPKSFHEVLMYFLVRHSFLTEVPDNLSDFKFLNFASVSHPAQIKVFYISMTTCFLHSNCPSIIDQMTD